MVRHGRSLCLRSANLKLVSLFKSLPREGRKAWTCSFSHWGAMEGVTHSPRSHLRLVWSAVVSVDLAHLCPLMQPRSFQLSSDQCPAPQALFQVGSSFCPVPHGSNMAPFHMFPSELSARSLVLWEAGTSSCVPSGATQLQGHFLGSYKGTGTQSAVVTSSASLDGGQGGA